MKITFGNNFIPQSPASNSPSTGTLFAAQEAQAAKKDAFVRSIKFGNEYLDPDLNDFEDLINQTNPPDHMLDKIIRGNQKVNPDGSISFPVNRIPRPTFNYHPNPPMDIGNEGQDGDEGDGGPGGPGQKPGPPGPGQPGTGSGDGDIGDEIGDGEGQGQGGDEAGEGEGDYGREQWGPGFSPSDIAKLMGKSWGLPFIEDRGKGEMKQTFETHDSRRSVPPGKVLTRKTMGNIAGKKLTLDLIDNENLEAGLKRLRPAIAEFEEALAGLQGQEGVSEELLKAADDFKAELRHFENEALPIVEKSRDQVFMAALETFKTQLKSSVGTPAFATEALPAFKTALDKIKRRSPDDPNNYVVNPGDIVRMDTRVQTKPHTQAVIFYIMDVSGSVSNDMKQMARTNNFLLSTWLKYQYGQLAAKSQGKKYNDKDFFGKGVQERFIVHTDGAKEVTGEEFYTTRQSGGTTISSAYKLLKEIVDEEYDPKKWNIYIFQYSDGDSWGDNNVSGDIIEELMTKYDANLLGYVNLKDPRWNWGGSDNFDAYLRDRFGDNPRIRRTSLSHNSLEVYQKAIKTLLEPEDKKGGKKAA